MKKSILILSLLISSQCYATVSDGPYLGINIGGANQNISFLPNSFNLNTNGSNLSNYSWSFLTRLNVGYNIDKWNGFELAPSYIFSSNYQYPNNNSSVSFSATTLDLSYIGYLPISDTKLSVFGRIGIAYDWVNNGSNSGCSYSSTTQGLNPAGSNFADILGAGIKYNLGPNSSFRIEWISNGLIFPVGINSGSTNVANWNVQTFQLGMNYHF